MPLDATLYAVSIGGVGGSIFDFTNETYIPPPHASGGTASAAPGGLADVIFVLDDEDEELQHVLALSAVESAEKAKANAAAASRVAEPIEIESPSPSPQPLAAAAVEDGGGAMAPVQASASDRVAMAVDGGNAKA